MSLLYTVFLVSSFLGVFSWAAPSLPAQSPSEPPRTVCVRRSTLLSFVIPPGSTFVPAVEGGLVVGNITSEYPSTIPSAASFSSSASDSLSGSLSSTPEPNSSPFLPIHQLENVCNPGLFSDTTGTLYNLGCGWSATGNPVFEGSFRDIQSCASECTLLRNNGTGCESIIYNELASTESQEPNCRGIVEPSDPHAQDLLEYAVPILNVTTSNAISSAQLPTYITLSFPATPTLLTISTGPLDSDTSGTTSTTLSLPTTSVSTTLSSPVSLATFSSTASSSSPSLISTFSTDSASGSSATMLTSSFSSSSLSSVFSSTISSTTQSFTSISSMETQASFSPSSSTTSSQSSPSSSSLSATFSSTSTTSLSTTTTSLETSLSSSSISTITLSTPSDAPASISTLSSSSFVDVTATSPSLFVSSTTSTTIPSTSIFSPTIFSTSSTASITPAPTSDCSSNYLQNGDFQTLVNGLPEPWIFEKDAADGDATSVSVEEVPHDPPQSPPDNDILMTINNTNQAAPTPSARSVSLRQTIPPLCPGAAYRLFWTNRITITNSARKLKRAPVEAQNCTVGFDLLDQVISVMGGANGAPLPYTQTTSGDIFRYQGFLDHNALTVTLNCTAEYGEYRIDDIFFLGPTGACCGVGGETATYNSTEYSLSTL